MRNKIAFWVIPAVCGLLAVLLIGFFLVRNAASDTLRVQTDRMAQAYVYEQTAVQTVSDPVNLNTADKKMLMTLAGVGEVLAQRILDYREVAGGFITAEQLMEVEGIGEAKFAQLREYITVEGSYENPGR